MKEVNTYSSCAVLHELNRREFRKKLDLLPAAVRHYIILKAAGIISAEIAKRVDETPAAIDYKRIQQEIISLIRKIYAKSNE